LSIIKGIGKDDLQVEGTDPAAKYTSLLKTICCWKRY